MGNLKEIAKVFLKLGREFYFQELNNAFIVIGVAGVGYIFTFF